MLLSDVENATRQDLFDPLGGPSQRWLTSDVDRAIDKAVDRYSVYYPNIAFVDMSTQPWQRTYPYPTSWNATYPVMWLERILYPLQTFGSYFAAPSTGPTAASGAAGNVNGTVQYAVTFLSQGGESTPSPLTPITVASKMVNLSNIPIGPTTTTVPGIAVNNVIGRNIYRTVASSNVLQLLATIADNVSTTYVDNTLDSVLTGPPARPTSPTVNTSGVMLWPPYERDFFEYSNLFDSASALAAGGNLGAMGAIGDPQGENFPGATQQVFTLKLTSAELPQDSTSVMRVFYATKHQLDSNGSTIPEIHRDIIVLGAVAYAMEAYQVPTNDNFDFQDGALRDRIDDQNIPEAWRQAAKNKMEQFTQRLDEIKHQRDFASSAHVQWGDVAARWPRL